MEEVRFKPHDSVVFERVQQELVLLDVDSGTYYGLNEVGARLWDLLARGIDKEEALTKLLDEYNTTRDQLEHDVDRLIAELQNKRLLVKIDSH
jgi:hypothetical protein